MRLFTPYSSVNLHSASSVRLPPSLAREGLIECHALLQPQFVLHKPKCSHGRMRSENRYFREEQAPPLPPLSSLFTLHYSLFTIHSSLFTFPQKTKPLHRRGFVLYSGIIIIRSGAYVALVAIRAGQDRLVLTDNTSSLPIKVKPMSAIWADERL